MTNGVQPTFIFQEDQLWIPGRESSGYVLVCYWEERRGILVVSLRNVRARALEFDSWMNPGETHYRSHNREAQISAKRLQL